MGESVPYWRSTVQPSDHVAGISPGYGSPRIPDRLPLRQPFSHRWTPRNRKRAIQGGTAVPLRGSLPHGHTTPDGLILSHMAMRDKDGAVGPLLPELTVSREKVNRFAAAWGEISGGTLDGRGGRIHNRTMVGWLTWCRGDRLRLLRRHGQHRRCDPVGPEAV